MTDSRTLTTLTRASRGVAAERALCCPQCRGPIELRLCRYCCEGNCRDSWATLAELAIVEARP